MSEIINLNEYKDQIFKKKWDNIPETCIFMSLPDNCIIINMIPYKKYLCIFAEINNKCKLYKVNNQGKILEEIPL